MAHDLELFCLSLALNKGWVRVRHQLPGRIRLGLENSTPDLPERLKEHSDVQQVDFNPLTGSLLIHYRGSENKLLKQLYQLLPDRPQAEAHIQKPLQQVYQTLDQGMRRLTGNWLDLRTAVGLGVAAYALRRKGRGPYLLWSYSHLQ